MFDKTIRGRSSARSDIKGAAFLTPTAAFASFPSIRPNSRTSSIASRLMGSSLNWRRKLLLMKYQMNYLTNCLCWLTGFIRSIRDLSVATSNQLPKGRRNSLSGKKHAARTSKGLLGFYKAGGSVCKGAVPD